MKEKSNDEYLPFLPHRCFYHLFIQVSMCLCTWTLDNGVCIRPLCGGATCACVDHAACAANANSVRYRWLKIVWQEYSCINWKPWTSQTSPKAITLAILKFQSSIASATMRARSIHHRVFIKYTLSVLILHWYAIVAWRIFPVVISEWFVHASSTNSHVFAQKLLLFRVSECVRVFGFFLTNSQIHIFLLTLQKSIRHKKRNDIIESRYAAIIIMKCNDIKKALSLKQTTTAPNVWSVNCKRYASLVSRARV